MLKAKKNSFSFNLKFLKSSKFWAFFVFFLILGGLPISLYEVQQQQNSQQHAAWYVNRTQHYYCSSILSVDLILGTETPDCSTGFNGNASSFQASMIIKASQGSVGAYTVHWMWGQFWCQDPNTSPCLQNGTGQEHTGGLTGDNVAFVTATSDVVKPNVPYSNQACGVYQLDFGFYITPNDQPNNHLCTSVVLGVNQLGQTNNNASWCNTQKTCQVIVNTPTPTVTATPTTPVNTPTPTLPIDTPTPTIPIDTPTETPIPSATPTSTPSATPTFTITPTGTLTPSATPTVTPTGAPTSTPVPPGSPTPTVIVFKPTLPPTGPGNTILSVGLVGVAIAVLGMAFLLGI